MTTPTSSRDPLLRAAGWTRSRVIFLAVSGVSGLLGQRLASAQSADVAATTLSSQDGTLIGEVIFSQLGPYVAIAANVRASVCAAQSSK